MNTLTKEKTITTREIAEQLSCSTKTVRENAKKCLSNKIFENGKQTFWTEEEVTVLLEYMKGHNNRTDLPVQPVVQATETSLTNALRIDMAYQKIDLIHKEIEKILQDENEKLKQENLKLETEKENLKIELDESKEWYSVKRMEKLNPEKEFNWRLLKTKSDEMGLERKDVFDQNYGTVKAYHVSVWEELYFDSINY